MNAKRTIPTKSSVKLTGEPALEPRRRATAAARPRRRTPRPATGEAPTGGVASGHDEGPRAGPEHLSVAPHHGERARHAGLELRASPRGAVGVAPELARLGAFAQSVRERALHQPSIVPERDRSHAVARAERRSGHRHCTELPAQRSRCSRRRRRTRDLTARRADDDGDAAPLDARLCRRRGPSGIEAQRGSAVGTIVPGCAPRPGVGQPRDEGPIERSGVMQEARRDRQLQSARQLIRAWPHDDPAAQALHGARDLGRTGRHRQRTHEPGRTLPRAERRFISPKPTRHAGSGCGGRHGRYHVLLQASGGGSGDIERGAPRAQLRERCVGDARAGVACRGASREPNDHAKSGVGRRRHRWLGLGSEQSERRGSEVFELKHGNGFGAAPLPGWLAQITDTACRCQEGGHDPRDAIAAAARGRRARTLRQCAFDLTGIGHRKGRKTPRERRGPHSLRDALNGLVRRRKAAPTGIEPARPRRATHGLRDARRGRGAAARRRVQQRDPGAHEIFGVDSFADSAVVIKARIKTPPIEPGRWDASTGTV